MEETTLISHEESRVLCSTYRCHRSIHSGAMIAAHKSNETRCSRHGLNLGVSFEKTNGYGQVRQSVCKQMHARKQLGTPATRFP